MRREATAATTVMLVASLCWAQEQVPTAQQSLVKWQESSALNDDQLITVPAGTRIALSLIVPIHTKTVQRGETVHLETHRR